MQGRFCIPQMQHRTEKAVFPMFLCLLPLVAPSSSCLPLSPSALQLKICHLVKTNLIIFLFVFITECILEPLSLPESPASPDGVAAVESSPSVPCIFCEECYVLAEQNQLLKHMIIEHKLVIADVKLVADFKRYGMYCLY